MVILRYDYNWGVIILKGSNLSYPINLVRQQFPALRRTYKSKPAAYFDGPGGSQVAAAVIEAIASYMKAGGANVHGLIPSSIETDYHILEARKAMADLLGVNNHDEIAFGANATTLAFAISRSVSRDWKPGDEIVVTELDHRGNVDPWIAAAKDKGVTVRWIKVDTETFTLELSDLDTLINEKTVLVAVGLASNVVGTINEVEKISIKAKQVGALVVVDAVQAVPHIYVDRDYYMADILLCSPYKFFGPHLGVAAIKWDLFEKLLTYRLEPAPLNAPDKLETGTQNHEALAGLKPAVEFIASLGSGSTRKEQIISGYHIIEEYEDRLANKIRAALASVSKVKLYQAPEHVRKTPTVAFTVEGMAPMDVTRFVLEEYSVFIANGNFYASTLAEKLGIIDKGAWVRLGLSPYNSEEEADRFIEAIYTLTGVK